MFDIFPTEPLSRFRASVVYSTLETPLYGPRGANGTFDTYEAVRFADGWRTVRRITPTGAEATLPVPGGIAADHEFSFVFAQDIDVFGLDTGTLAEGGSADYLGNPDGSFELTGVGSLGTERLVDGMFISPGGGHVIFQSGGAWCGSNEPCLVRKLEPEAPPTGTAAVYDRAADGPTRVVSLLPGDLTPAAGEAATYQGTSSDGSVIAFKIGGALYVRVGNSRSEKVASAPATFAGISGDAESVFFVSDGDIFAFDVGSEQRQQINDSGDAEPVNISTDGSHVYFVSPSLLDGGSGTAGLPNMYVWTRDGESIQYIATVLPSDLHRTSGSKEQYPGLANWTDWAVAGERGGQTAVGLGPGADSSRTTPDGTVLVFESRGKLTEYENAGRTEVYRYDAPAQSLLCLSCDPQLPAAQGDSRLQELATAGPDVVIHNLSEDGSRVFFETPEALVGRDTDGINDIYEWREQGDGSAPAVELISSGRSVEYSPRDQESEEGLPQPNILVGITPDSRDVLFLSQDALVPGAGQGGATALYDARVEGGFAPLTPNVECNDRVTCQGGGSAEAPLTSPRSARVKPRRHCRHSKTKAAKHRKRGCRHRKHRPSHDHRRGGTG